MTSGKNILLYSTLGIIGIYFLILSLVQAKGILAPLLTAFVLSLVILPLSNKLEKMGIKRGLSSIVGVFLLFLVSLGFMALISFQVENFVESWPKIQATMKPKVDQIKTLVFENTMLSEKDFGPANASSNGLLEGNVKSAGKQVYSFFSGTLGFMGNYLLAFIYIFFLLNYRQHLKAFILKLFDSEKKEKVENVIRKVGKVAQQYLIGKMILMTLLAVLYGVGLGLSGVNNFILVSIIAALLTLIPYIGNVIGFSLATVFGYLATGEISVLIGIIITFTVTQFVESYILQPYIVGDRVDLHPFIVILAVIIGGALWGISGMILAIPLTGIMGLIFLHVPILHPLGFLFSKGGEHP